MNAIPAYPVRLAGGEVLKRSRLTVLFRIILLIPHLLLLALYGLGVFFVVIIAWFAALFTGRVPGGMHDFIAGYVRYSGILFAYATILSDRFPPFASDDRYEVEIEIDPPVAQNRLTVFFRLILVLPCMVLIGYVLDPLIGLVAIANWFVALVTGRVPAGLQRLGLWIVRFRSRSYAYAMLVNPRYPAFGDTPAGSLPPDQASLPPIP